MKIIDFEKKGNVVRFYLGSDDCKDYYGDDWDDKPYEHNAGLVYERYVVGHRDVAFPFEYAVVEPCDGVMNSKWSKDDMKQQKVPCIVAVPNADRWYEEYFNEMNHNPQAIKFYFGDKMTPSDKIEIYKEK